jgi:hypothetical protein
MTETKRDDQCIERLNLHGRSHYYSVTEYEAGLRWGNTLSSSKARAFHGVIWTEGAPKVEELTTEWPKIREGKFRICDWDVYDMQMWTGSTSTP